VSGVEEAVGPRGSDASSATGENPLRWGVPVGRVAGIRVRLHWLFVAYIAASLIFTLPHHRAGVAFELPALIALFVLVLAHEFGHCIACRRVGGEADEIVLWPLGGLAQCRAPHDWRAELWTVLGGPLVNAVLLPLLAAACYLATRSWSVALPNPLDPVSAMVDLQRPDGTVPYWLVALWSFHWANITLLVFNMAVPMYPMDGGRIVQCLLWARLGYHRSLWIACHIGLGAAAVMGTVGALAADGKLLMAIGLFGAVVCWTERRRLQFLAGVEPQEQPVASTPEMGGDDAPFDQAEVDRILAKISEVGMGGLSGSEKRTLKRATERSRETEGRKGKSDQ
jgi:Zn-dependent protease